MNITVNPDPPKSLAQGWFTPKLISFTSPHASEWMNTDGWKGLSKIHVLNLHPELANLGYPLLESWAERQLLTGGV